MISNDLIINNINADVRAGSIELADYPPSRDGQNVRDQYTECIGVTMGINRDHLNDLAAAFRGNMLGNCYDLGQQISYPVTQNPGFPTGSASEPYPYSRFWHGYQILTRPLLALGGWDLLCASLAGLLALSTIVLLRASPIRDVRLAILVLIVALITGLDVRTIYSSPLVLISLTVTNVVAWLIIRSAPQSPKGTHLIVSGYCLNFFLLLVNQALIVIFLTTVSLIALGELSKPSKYFPVLTRTYFLLAFGWFLALLTRILFWRLWSPFDEIIESLQSTTVSADLPALEGLNSARKLQVAITTNFDYWRQSGYRSKLLEGLSVIGFFFLVSLLTKNRDFGRLRTFLVQNSIVYLSFACWFGVFATHSTLHAIFVWRAIPSLLAATLSICILFLLRFKAHSPSRESIAS